MDLSLVPTDDLLEALQKRFDRYVFSGFQLGAAENGGPDGRNDNNTIVWSGHATWCIGMCIELIDEIREKTKGRGESE